MKTSTKGVIIIICYVFILTIVTISFNVYDSNKHTYKLQHTGERYVSQGGKPLIKGNINSRGEKIYHMPEGVYYSQTIPEHWFITEAEAQAKGYRRAMR